MSNNIPTKYKRLARGKTGGEETDDPSSGSIVMNLFTISAVGDVLTVYFVAPVYDLIS